MSHPHPEPERGREPFVATGYLEEYRERGFAVVRGLFRDDEVAEIAAAFDRIHAEGLRHPSSYRHQNVLFRQGMDARLGRILRLVQWPSYFDATLDAVRLDERVLDVLEPLIGGDLKQIINQMHWKPPGAASAEFAFHQDIRFRRPRAAFRDLAASYVQTGLAIDPHTPLSGCMRMLPGSHRLGELSLGADGPVLDRRASEAELARAGLDPAGLVDLALEPGDFAIWHLLTVHGSGPNRSAGDRRFYINGYVTADNADRGVWAFRNKRACPLGEPVLIHYEDLYRRPGPFYLEAG
jgi:ectoine hydroxylase-related dioxygenase (phytanoyl-CoA dioxygenase family)